jgi:hypothetical protein
MKGIFSATAVGFSSAESDLKEAFDLRDTQSEIDEVQ